MIESYLEARAGCKTVNQLNVLHISLENQLAPLEVAALRHELDRRRLAPAGDADPSGAPNWSEQSEVWIARLVGRIALSGKPRPERFARRTIVPDVTMYSSGGATRDKTLAICFAGSAQRLMMPVPCFLQHLDASRFDVVVLRDAARRGFRAGIPGVGGNLTQVVEKIGENQRRSYGSVVSYGTSGGGVPALWAALQLKLEKGVSVGGNSPEDSRWTLWGDGGVAVPFRYYLERNQGRTELLLVHGADAPEDAEAARQMREAVPADLVAVSGRDGRPCKHNATLPLLEGGVLGRFLELALQPGSDLDELRRLAAAGDAAAQ